MNRRRFSLVLAASALAAGPGGALAQAWPDKPVRLVLSQPAGSGADTIARLVTEPLARKWGQAIVVDNRPGGQNTIGAQAAARAAADGTTFYFGTLAALVTNAYLFKGLPYDPRKDFVPVGMVGKVPFVLAVNVASPIRTLQEFMAQAKAAPGKLTVADEGPKTFGGMVARVMATQAGIQVNHVPYVSVAAAVNDTVGGQTEAIVSDAPSAAAMIKAGRLRPLAVTTARRVAGWDNVPPLADALPGFDYAGWLAIVAPAGTPAAAIQRFNRDLDAVLLDKEMAARIAAIGPVTEGAGTVEQTGAFLQAEHARWSRIVRDLGVLPE